MRVSIINKVFFKEIFYSVFLLHKRKFYIDCNYFNHAKIFLLRLFRMVANTTVYTRLEQRSLIRFLVAEKCKPCEIYRRMYNVYRKAFLVQKIFTDELNMGLLLQSWRENVVETLTLRQKFRVLRLLKVMVRVFRDMRRHKMIFVKKVQLLIVLPLTYSLEKKFT